MNDGLNLAHNLLKPGKRGPNYASNRAKRIARALIREHRSLKWALETILWMSGSPSFSPNGEAAKGWKRVRTRLHRELSALKAREAAR